MKANCKGCGSEFLSTKSSHTYCSKKCWKRVEHAKYRARLKAKREAGNLCARCHTVATDPDILYCDSCRDVVLISTWQSQRIHKADEAESTKKKRRLMRENSAPGLSTRQRALLLKTWKSQQKVCTYCANLADTVDHVIPLTRGGTNYEGNLIPACRKCNAMKRTRLITEWKFLDVRTSA